MKQFLGGRRAVQLAKGLFFLNGLIWLGLSVAGVLRLVGGNPATLAVVSLLMFGNSAAMFLAGLLLGEGRRLGYVFALALLLVNILLTFTDQVGLLDWLTVAIDLILLGLLLGSYRVYVGRGKGEAAD